jgi:serine protease Do
VNVEILRDGKVKRLKVVLGELPEEDETVAEAKPNVSNEGRLKVEVTDLTDEQREALEIEAGGVIVTRIQAGPARKAGVRRGDVIVMVDNINVKNAPHFKELVDGLSANKSVPLLVQRRGGPVFLALKIEE